MADEIRDLDDVEAQAWTTTYAAFADRSNSPEVAAEEADECIRLLRERRRPSALRDDPTIAEMARDHEREKVVAWLRAESERLDGLADALESSGEQAPAERFSAFRLRSAAHAIDSGEHDR